jgi:hypothetical protein
MKKVNDVIWIRNSDNYIVNSPKNVHNIKDLLDTTGCGFCLAKFTQVTLHLGTGLVHSCHHPSPHKIPLEELEGNPSALFNTSVLKNARKEMLENVKPSECDYCWRVEDSNGPSDRFFKSLESWALHKHDEILEKGHNHNYYPTYLEVDFSNVCNFQCIYCGPEYSSVWVEDLKKNGPLKVLDETKKVQWVQGWQNLDTLNYKNREFNPYIDAFWKWFPEAYKHLKVYRITGGEPLLSKETLRSMDWFIENPNPDLEFNINSNLGVPDKIWDQFIEKLKVLVSGNNIKKFTMFTSVDAWGERAEYLRYGLNFELFKKRYEELLNIGGVRCCIMVTFNILSITSFKDFLKWVLELKRKYNLDPTKANWEAEFGYNLGGEIPHSKRKELHSVHNSIVGIDVPYLRHPALLDVHFADKNLIENYLIPAMDFMAQNTSNIKWGIHDGFEDYEIEKLKRIVIEAMHFTKNNSEESEMFVEHRAKFYDFVNEIDKRHNRNFLETFPEMTEFYEKCKENKLSILKNK